MGGAEDHSDGVRDLVDYRNVRIDAARHTVRFARPGVEIDLGGIAKGYAADAALTLLREKHGMKVRGYVSTVIACPYEGKVAPAKVAEVSELK